MSFWDDLEEALLVELGVQGLVPDRPEVQGSTSQTSALGEGDLVPPAATLSLEAAAIPSRELPVTPSLEPAAIPLGVAHLVGRPKNQRRR